MDKFLYQPGHGLFYRLDPRIKLLFVASVAAYLSWETATTNMLIALTGLHILCLLAPATRARIPLLWKTIAPLMAMILLFGSLRWRAGAPLLALGPVTITAPALWRALGLGSRIAGLTMAFSLMLWSTEPGDMVVGLTRLGIPFELSFPAVMAGQQIITFNRLFVQILEAQQSRGLTLSRKNPFQAARAYLPVIVPLLIGALRQADDLSLALQARGFGLPGKRTFRRTLAIRGRDWLFILAVWICLFALTQVCGSLGLGEILLQGN